MLLPRITIFKAIIHSMELTNGKDLNTIVLQAPIGLCILDAATLKAEIVNDKFLQVAGRSYHDIAGNYYWDVFAEVRSVYEAALASVVETGNSYHANEAEMKLFRNGKEETVVVTFVYDAIKDDSGKVNKVAVWVLENTRQVNERQKVELSKVSLQAERDRLKRFLMQVPAGICVLDGPELIYELVNPVYQDMLPGRRLLGRPIFEALPELVDTPVHDILLNVYKNGVPYRINELLVPISKMEGGPTYDRFFDLSYQPRLDENDKVDGILVFAYEVTGIVNIQQDLQQQRTQADQQQRLYEAISSGTPDLMYVFDLDYRFSYANEALLSMWGKTKETAIGRNLLENGYEPWHAAMHEREIDNIRINKMPIRGEVAFPHASLGKRIYDYILTPVLNEHNEVEAVAGVTRDVTDRKKAEELLAQASEELQAINEELAASNEELTATNEELAIVNQRLVEAQQKIEESEITLRLAINAANFGTWFIHSETRKFICDARLKELFGFYPDEELTIEQTLAQIPGEYREHVSAALENAIYHGGDYDVTYPVTGRHDQQLRWLRAIGNLKADPSGTFSAFTGVVMDVTQQKTDEIRKNDFIGMVSHELKTPLTSLSAIVQVAHSKLKDSDDNFVAGAMEKANIQVKKMTNMINGFLNISRLESGKLLVHKQEFALVELLEEMIEDARISLSSHIIDFMAAGKITLNADRDKIGSVISNLISNAVKYSPSGKTISIRCTKEDGSVVVSVSDEGTGIKPDDLEKIFDRYYRVDTNYTRHIAGFGIGLYLSSEIIKVHGGRIWAESEPGVGSAFYFSLPVVDE